MRSFKLILLLKSVLILNVFLLSCQDNPVREVKSKGEERDAPAETLFSLLPSSKTNVSFNNRLTESPYANIMMYQYFYNGGGVAIGDLNNNGLQDIYFSGNMTSNRLYLNKGDMSFDDITAQAGVAGRERAWKTGVSMADVNGDGLLDIYVCYSGHMPGEARVNELLINQGPDANGHPRFVDQAPQYGLADSSYSTNASFFDYDRDGDLDMFLLNHNPSLFRNLDDVTINEILKHDEPDMRVKLFRHDEGPNGTPVFKDVTDKAGFAGSAFTYGLGAGIADINNDGWPDIYISNDYSAPDYLYINNGDGTFTDKLRKGVGHTSLYSMGNDVADINNDGQPDIFVLDMLPEDNRRQKLLFAPDNYEHFDLFLRVGFYYQYMRNMLHVNTGNRPDGSPVFSEVGQLSGISNTDWSWAPLLADYDNDGWKDIFVTNGFRRDFTNMDFIKYRSSYMQSVNGNAGPEGILALVRKIPSSNVNNYIYKNKGDLTFADMSADWGMDIPSNSNGAAYADLDGDGDLDLVINNIDKPAFIYQNRAGNQLKNHYLQLKLEGEGRNTQGIGAKVRLYAQGKQQYQEQMPARGYQSSVTPIMHFGLGEDSLIDSLEITWQSGKRELLQNIEANQLLSLQEKNAAVKKQAVRSERPVFEEVKSPLAFTDPANKINDFKRQPLLVNPLSFSGPCMIKADVNGDELEDVFVGGAAGQAGVLYIQQNGGRFLPKALAAFEADKMSEDADALFFDANGDGKPDLYVASGGYGNFLPEDPLLQDRLYLNDGKGGFTRNSDALPAMLSSSSCVRAADINGDGHDDLFVGGRVVPGRYPETPESYVLINDGKGNYQDMTASVAPELRKAGMVTDAAWHDLNKDGQQELLVVGEWMPVSVFSLQDGKLSNVTNSYFDKKYSGWWNKLVVGDFNQDGKPDLLIGNHGLNSQVKASEQEPAEMWYKDFDDNGSVDPILCFYIQGKSYPYVTRDELLDQMSMMRTRFPNYESYANATLQKIFTTEELKGATYLAANYLKTAYFESGAKGKFIEKELPVEAQFSPVHELRTIDYNQDGIDDLLLAGNVSQARLRFGKSDANYGIILQGDGKGGFSYVPQNRAGLHLAGDVRSILKVNDHLLFGINQQAVKAYKMKQ